VFQDCVETVSFRCAESYTQHYTSPKCDCRGVRQFGDVKAPQTTSGGTYILTLWGCTNANRGMLTPRWSTNKSPFLAIVRRCDVLLTAADLYLKLSTRRFFLNRAPISIKPEWIITPDYVTEALQIYDLNSCNLQPSKSPPSYQAWHISQKERGRCKRLTFGMYYNVILICIGFHYSTVYLPFPYRPMFAWYKCRQLAYSCGENYVILLTTVTDAMLEVYLMQPCNAVAICVCLLTVMCGIIRQSKNRVYDFCIWFCFSSQSVYLQRGGVLWRHCHFTSCIPCKMLVSHG